jgi:copper chaperone CopZ
MRYLSHTAEEIDEKLKRVPADWEAIADQTYKPESGYAQSGKAVAEAVNEVLSEVDSKLENISVTIEVDQAYDDTSENAQSGTAVAEAIALFREDLNELLPKIEVITDLDIDSIYSHIDKDNKSN